LIQCLNLQLCIAKLAAASVTLRLLRESFLAAVMEHRMRTTRRTFVQASLAATAAATLLPISLRAQQSPPTRRAIPSTREEIPIVGLGTWITFNVGDDPVLRDECKNVMAAFFEAGGRVIDSSPMYGSSQPVIGYGLQKLGRPSALFSAEKVWTSSGAAGPAQIEQSRRFWGVPKFDLIQVHNLLTWKAHLQTLFQMKAAGAVRYVGITTSEGRRHDLLEQIMRNEPIDFVQFSYNVVDREAEARLLPLASERGIAVIVNRPFRQGALTDRLKREPLPEWAREFGVSSWAQLMLKFILSHPAVTVAIPATTRVDHVRENLAAAAGPMPDPAMRERISAHVKAL
jgi:diketogulonate reductase-like aldo/keto reductase